MSYFDELAAKLRQDFEGDIPWMYLDSVGKVTVGVGCMLGSALEATALPFGKLPAGGTLATPRVMASPSEIVADYERVYAMKPNCGPRFYLNETALTLSPQAITDVLAKKLNEFDDLLHEVFPAFGSYPIPARMALLDMAYNLGVSRLTSEYPLMCAAVVRGDWNGVAERCHRRGPSAYRNDWTKSQFLEAAK